MYRPITEVSGFQKNVYCAAAEFFAKQPQGIISSVNGKVQLILYGQN
jgi:hypothetical protein